ncbi:MAG: site-2 protease family protein [Cyanobacteria bacterium P01_A01_bin.45]
MFTGSETPIIATVVLVALGILGWGFYRAKPFGKLGILAWLQSVVLMTPWLVFFGLFAAGIYVNTVGVLLFLIISVGLYIFIGRKLRDLGQDAIIKQKATQRIAALDKASLESPSDNSPPSLNQESPIATIPDQDLSMIREIFGIDTFFVTETIPYQEGAIFKGNLRGEAQETHNSLTTKIQERLDDKYRLFLVESAEGKPVVIVLPKQKDPRQMTLAQKVFGIILFFATVATSMEASGLLLKFDFFNSPQRYPEVLPLATGILAILIAHEIGHWVIARRYDVRLSLPYFIPSIQIGSFGTITRFESLLPNRQTLFDIAIAGPIIGGITSLVMLISGLALSHSGSVFQLPSEFFKGSILVGTLAKLLLGSTLESPLIDVHPLVIIGWVGLVITALNLMPAGQLDGGRIVQAIYGRKIARRTTIATLIILGIVSLGNSLAIYWAVVILFLQRDLERPSLNEITEPDDIRAALCLFALFLMIIILIPLTPALALRLGIGS